MRAEQPVLRKRLILDANVFISYLLGQGLTESTIFRAVRLALSAQFELLAPAELFQEIRDAPHKPELAGILTSEMAERLILDIALVASQLAPITLTEHAGSVQDPKGRYLLEAAITCDVDLLVSGDKHLLGLRDALDRPRIMSPADFVAEFGEPAS
jgi:putative PIN family toxin of toxin-antitoxin system